MVVAREKQRPRATGFTLLEVLVTMALLVACFSIAMPSLVSMIGSDSLDRAGEDIRALVVGLRLRAIDEADRLTLEMEPGTGRFRVQSAKAPVDAVRELAEPTKGRVEYDDDLGSHELETGVTFVPQPTENASPSNDGIIRIQFWPDGTVTDIAFALADSEGRQRWIEVRGLTGSVRIGPPRDAANGQRVSTGPNGRRTP